MILKKSCFDFFLSFYCFIEIILMCYWTVLLFEEVLTVLETIPELATSAHMQGEGLLWVAPESRATLVTDPSNQPSSSFPANRKHM